MSGPSERLRSEKPDVSVTTTVAIDPQAAFRVFTEEIDTWWRRGPRHRFSRQRIGILRFEGGSGGRLVEVYDEAAGDMWEVGKVLGWEPGVRLAFEWRLRNFAPEDRTEVEVQFQAVANGTRVTVSHRGLVALRKDHPVRHALEGDSFTDMIGLWWGEIVVGMRAHTKKQ